MRHESTSLLAERDIHCILFDLGSTLWYRNKAVWPHFVAAAHLRTGALLHAHHIPNPAHLDDLHIGKLLQEALNQRFRHLIRAHLEQEPCGAQVVLQVLQEWGMQECDLAFSQLVFEALRIPEEHSRLLFEDTLSTLAALQAHGFRLGVITNRLWGGEPFLKSLETLKMSQYFARELMAVSSDLGIRKPHPSMYLHVLKAQGITPEQAVMVGDSLPADVVGPQRLGMFAIWKPKPSLIQQVKTHLERYGQSLSSYNPYLAAQLAQHATRPLPDTSDAQAFEGLFEDILHHGDWFVQFKCGQLQPDGIIERVSDLLALLGIVNLFVKTKDTDEL